MNSLFYLSGVIMWVVIALSLTYLLALLLWGYISISVVYWWVAIKTGAMKASYKNKPLPKVRLLFLILFKPSISFDFSGSVISNDKYRIDCTGLIPRFIIYKSA